MADREKRPEFPIVGIGASAGGLEAFKEFFSGIPADESLDMAFVLVQHLAPDHKSILTDIIKRHTSMEVLEVENGMPVKPGRVYIIPPDQSMSLNEGKLNLSKPASPHGQQMPIDIFFRSLAQDQGEKAIGIVLSGTGADGTLGLRAIKGQGGMAMVQTPESAKYSGMPNSAINTELIDYQLPPEEMPAKLKSFVSHALKEQDEPAIKITEQEKRFKKIFVILRNQTEHDFSGYKTNTIIRRVQHRMSVQQISKLERYVQYLEHNPGEVDKLFKNLLIGVTSFFREEKAFEVLSERVIPDLFASRREERMIRVWVPGCATGEEAYSLAILFKEHQEKQPENYKVQIFATDIDGKAIAQARRGVFPGSIAADIKSERLSRFFESVDEKENYRVHKEIRNMVIFSEQNLIDDPPFSRLDLISCRNVLIYLKRELQKKILSLFRYALNSEGYLFLGPSENLRESSTSFSAVDESLKIYQLKEGFQSNVEMVENNFLPPMTGTVSVDEKSYADFSEGSEDLSLQEITENKLLEQFVPPAVLVDSQGQVLYIHGRTGSFLEPAPGRAGFYNIVSMARDDLRSEITNALNESVQEEKKVFRPDITVQKQDETLKANLSILPIKNETRPQLQKRLYLIVLEKAGKLTEKEAEEIYDLPMDENISDPEAQKIIDRLRQKLQTKEKSLQNTVEELQTANEELRSSNEELQSTNEELQSTNEELQTSKEELQALNEELKTVNSELENKIEELQQTNTDMKNLISGTGIGTIFVDLDLKILRFTSSVTEFVNLIDSDIGRSIGDIALNLKNYNNLSRDIQKVLDTLIPREVEVQTQNDKWYKMCIQSYRTENNVVEGAVVTFRDIDERKKLENKLDRATASLAEQFVSIAREPVLVLNSEREVLASSSYFCDVFNTSSSAIQGRSLFSITEGIWDTAEIHQLLNDVVNQNAVIIGYELKLDREGKGNNIIKINARQLSLPSSSKKLIVLVCRNIPDNFKITGEEEQEGDNEKR
ncbi:chemotaxis protein CheB [Halarsenatibacter silvermanii]|uniref:Two-component system, chemotaxis family, CheB/CheR fusion protein n=1 Tax=Halarsenatibacter silvermanii TaxID=321763 RepID=A0A1G9T9R8_9FIRM|nr:chemotaxis protein CheB [Halarsenatibacter silvermanii]SDM44390.1 two-component system, chemotaxis family, CheB/CheR fusion protein [Halarsenatibacter silvermanii]